MEYLHIPIFSVYVCFYPTPCIYTSIGGLGGKESACHAGELGSIPGSGRSPGEENGSLL